MCAELLEAGLAALLLEPITKDEATSALDEQLEAEIYHMLGEVLPKTTIVSIGHRSTLIALHRRRIEMVLGLGGIFAPTPLLEVGSAARAQPSISQSRLP